ncbi:MAG: VCBS repeat-containing protein [Planctomycetes bacterium]|nr:VCBS repeat-containing protein [Planctomycetota bacterium]
MLSSCVLHQSCGSATATTLALLSLGSLSTAQSLLASTHGDSAGDKCGAAVSWLGDVDGDGLDDFLAGCPNDQHFGPQTGSVRTCSGRTGGLLYVVNGWASGDIFGDAIANIGDLDGDGRAEFVVGAIGSDLGASEGGSAFVFSGADGALRYVWSGDSPDDRFGADVSSGGDVDCDGVADVVVGAPRDATAGFFSGTVYVFSGKDGALIHALHGPAPGAAMGASVAILGDVNSDGHADILAGAVGDSTFGPSTGAAIVYSGASGAVLYSVHGQWGYANYARYVASTGDVNGDAVPDFVVGAPDESVTAFRSGSAYVYSGADGTLLYSFYGTDPDDFLGREVSGAGDANADGYADILVGAYNEPDHTIIGAAHVYSGRDGTLLFKVFGEYVGSAFGIAVSGGGDMNGDGFDDIVVGSPQAQVGAFFDGAAYVYSPSPLPPLEYCTAKLNSQGCLPRIDWAGSTSLSGADTLEVRGWNLIGHADAFLLLGARAQATPWHGATLCVDTPVLRLRASDVAGHPGRPCSGKARFPLPAQRLADLGLGAGSTFYVQVVARDPGFAPPDDFIATPGLRVTLCP